jgi:hypothetical protein
MHAHRPLRAMLRMLLADEGRSLSEAPTYTAVLRHLRKATAPAVVVAGNSTADFHEEAEFFGHITADSTPAGLARWNRFILLCTMPERLPAELRATLNSLGVPILHMPSQLPELSGLVTRVAGGRPTEAKGESAG